MYEDSNPSELSKKVAQKFELPQTSADRLRIEMEAQVRPATAPPPPEPRAPPPPRPQELHNMRVTAVYVLASTDSTTGCSGPQMVKRVQLRVNVDLQDGGGKTVMLVYREETAGIAARRFAVQNGLTAMGQKVRRACRRRRRQSHKCKPPCFFSGALAAARVFRGCLLISLGCRCRTWRRTLSGSSSPTRPRLSRRPSKDRAVQRMPRRVVACMHGRYLQTDRRLGHGRAV